MTRLRRSELSTPASNQKMMAKAAASDADLVFLDLEDSVAAAEKDDARKLAVEALNTLDWGSKTRAVRINSSDTPWSHEDIIEVVSGAGDNLDAIIVPKVKAPRDLWYVETLLEQLETKLGLKGPIGLEILIEEAEALARVEELAGCSPRLEALILGVGDLSASQGIRTGHISDPELRYPGDIWHYARNRMIVAARAHGLDAIDGPYPNIAKTDIYRRDCCWASTLGCVGKWAIHPDQVPIANEVFAPTEREVERARQVIDAMQAAQSGGEGSATLGGAMIDAATARIMQGTLDRWNQINNS